MVIVTVIVMIIVNSNGNSTDFLCSEHKCRECHTHRNVSSDTHMLPQISEMISVIRDFWDWKLQESLPKCYRNVPCMCAVNTTRFATSTVQIAMNVDSGEIAALLWWPRLSWPRLKMLSTSCRRRFARAACVLRCAVLPIFRAFAVLNPSSFATTYIWIMLIQSYMSKGIWRQGIGSFVRYFYVSTLCPVVICPY